MACLSCDLHLFHESREPKSSMTANDGLPTLDNDQPNLSGFLEIRGLSIRPPVMLAPMAGLTHSALRRLVAGFGGTGLMFTEMLSARSLPQEKADSSPYLLRSEDEAPLAYQILASTPEETERGAEIVEALGADGVDINMGCTAPAIKRRGAGCALLQDQERACSLVAAARSSTALPVTVKIRLLRPVEAQHQDVGAWLYSFCSRLQDAGADMITIHARFVGEPFSRPPKWRLLAGLRGRLSIPYVVNGGIDSVDQARAALDQSQADGIMIGRAAPQKPWLLSQIASQLYGLSTNAPEEIDPDLLRRTYLSFADDLTARFPPDRQLGRLKEFTHYFARNYLFGHTLAYGVQRARSVEQALEFAREFFSQSGHELCGIKK